MKRSEMKESAEDYLVTARVVGPGRTCLVVCLRSGWSLVMACCLIERESRMSKERKKVGYMNWT